MLPSVTHISASSGIKANRWSGCRAFASSRPAPGVVDLVLSHPCADELHRWSVAGELSPLAAGRWSLLTCVRRPDDERTT
jgi:hypothetical protein